MAQKITGSVSGFKELKDVLDHFAPRESRNLARAVQFGVATEVRDRIRARTPTLSGNLKKSIVAVRRRGAPDQPVSEVRVTEGHSAKHDGFYWFFQEFGTVRQPARPFVVPAVEEIRPEIPNIYQEQFGQKLERLLARQAKRGGR